MDGWRSTILKSISLVKFVYVMDYLCECQKCKLDHPHPLDE